jgi:hypothetical protein
MKELKKLCTTKIDRSVDGSLKSSMADMLAAAGHGLQISATSC